jgi:hypothetical protein
MLLRRNIFAVHELQIGNRLAKIGNGNGVQRKTILPEIEKDDRREWGK